MFGIGPLEIAFIGIPVIFGFYLLFRCVKLLNLLIKFLEQRTK